MSEDVLPDVNVLVALTWPNHLHHGVAREWFAGLQVRFATTPVTETALVRLSMNRAVTGTDVTAGEVLALVRAVREHPQHRFLADGSSLTQSVIALDRLATARQVTDAHLVNLCASERLVLVTFDRGIPDLLDPADRRAVQVLNPVRGSAA